MLIKMLSRSLSRPNLPQLIRYINEGKTHFDNEKNFILRHNTLGKNTKEVAEDFKQNNKFIKQGKQKRIGVQHIILSFHPKEKLFLNTEKLFGFAQKFSELMNFNSAITFGRVHFEKENIHLHFAVSASQFGNGKSRRISKQRLKEIQIDMNRYQQKFPELKHSLLYLPELEKSKKSTLTGIPLPEKMKETDGSIRAKKRGQKSLLENIKEKLISIAKKYPKKEDFLKSIEKEEDFSVYTRNGKPTGIITETNKKFRFTRLLIDIENLKKEVRLYELEQLKNRDQERSIEKQ
ncbi:Relaxase/Mobilisation nuclease domain-containing protein [Polaribacter sp. KT25b]|uniref:relaxase/mobilization nuclease domain-containing protein n=1 Tax=Polaribacter sp. KT25b TaxID=1855336 RepID=UPI00087D687C|nr:relaxase/mobilization nuclease domain-containing protein [Polaribacter sp. KT25b]SDR66939.1 Relaxase/Mobilisation nuclease domain-containing protein [Polaribacter sp. KT25b]